MHNYLLLNYQFLRAMPLERFASNNASKTSKRQEESRKLDQLALPIALQRSAKLVKNFILGHCDANKVFVVARSKQMHN